MTISEKLIRAKADLDSVYDAGVEKGRGEATEGVTVEPLEVTSNGTYTSPNGVGYSPVTVNVPDVNGSYNEGYNDGFEAGKAESAPEDLNDVLTAQEQKLAELSAILDKKASGGGTSGGSDMLKQLLEGTLTEIEDDTIETLRSNAFASCSSLKKASFPSLNGVGYKAFENCTSLTNFVIPKGIIDEQAFVNCKNLASVTFGANVTQIGRKAFYTCGSLTTIRFPQSVKTIQEYAFQACTGITSVTFEGTPTSIISNVFAGCSKLTTINVPWAEGKVANAPWGATNATINYNYTGG